ncbi:MAG: type II toxin-antitoxin system VapC family toxin [Rhizobacter sp.]
MLYLLDTNTATAAMRGTAGLDSRLQRLQPDEWCISAVTNAEMRYGVALKPKAIQLERYVDAFLAVARTEPWDEACAEFHALLRAQLRVKNHVLGDFDEMIAAHALALGAVLVTDNLRHFKRVEGLRVENWIRSS